MSSQPHFVYTITSTKTQKNRWRISNERFHLNRIPTKIPYRRCTSMYTTFWCSFHIYVYLYGFHIHSHAELKEACRLQPIENNNFVDTPRYCSRCFFFSTSRFTALILEVLYFVNLLQQQQQESKTKFSVYCGKYWDKINIQRIEVRNLKRCNISDNNEAIMLVVTS